VKLVDEIVNICAEQVVHLLTAGFPCVGFSRFGLKQGLQNVQSSLFHDAVKVISAIKPKMVLFENVHSILSAAHRDDLCFITTTMADLGYNMRWTTCSASDVGLPHCRKRWFALCTMKGETFNELIVPESVHTTPEPTLNAVQTRCHNKRYRMLGNTIVPMAARLAFFRLYTGFQIQSVSDLALVRTCSYSVDLVGTCPQPTDHGFITSMGQVAYIKVAKVRAVQVAIKLDVRQYLGAHRQRLSNTTRLDLSPKRETYELSMWPTPRTKCAHGSHVFTERGCGDLPTCARFASSVDGNPLAQTDSTHQVNIHWIEWLMGYPRDWTKLVLP
jgi:hypothetical protein